LGDGKTSIAAASRFRGNPSAARSLGQNGTAGRFVDAVGFGQAAIATGSTAETREDPMVDARCLNGHVGLCHDANKTNQVDLGHLVQYIAGEDAPLHSTGWKSLDIIGKVGETW